MAYYTPVALHNNPKVNSHCQKKICTGRDSANLREPVDKAIEISISHSHQNLQIWFYTSHGLPGQVPRNFCEPYSQTMSETSKAIAWYLH